MQKELFPDVLARRYATPEMCAIWSRTARVRRAREFWVTVLEAQRDLGVPIPRAAISAYRRAIDNIDLDSIARRERTLRHDNLAEIEEFNALAGYELIHLRLTSRDKDDNLDQVQILESLRLIRDRCVALLARLRARSLEWSRLNITARTHFMPAQVTTLGKRIATVAAETLHAFARLEQLIASYPARGIKGPVGTQQDLLELFGSAQKVRIFEKRLCEHFGFPATWESVGQVYPRSLDFETISVLAQLASGPGNLAKMIRLSAGLGLMQEGFTKGQKGSSAMPHKRNSRTCERINGLQAVLGGYLSMSERLLGDQWYEGDVSCSVVRRVALPGAFFAMDAIIEATLTVLDEMQIVPRRIKNELVEQLPFLASTRILGALVNAGMGRERAHSLIKKHAFAALRDTENGRENSFITRLGSDEAFPLPHTKIKKLLRPTHGLAEEQIKNVAHRIDVALKKYPKQRLYKPYPIL